METVVKLESYVPDIYKESRDFRVFLKLLDFIYENVKFDIDNWIYLYDPLETKSDFLPLLGEMLGYDNDVNFFTDELRIILDNIVELLKNRGSKLGLRRTANTILNAKYNHNINDEELKQAVSQLDFLEIYFDYNTGHIKFYFPKKIDYYKKFYDYIRPVGTYLDFTISKFPEPESDMAISTTASAIIHKDFKPRVIFNEDTGETVESDDTYRVNNSQVNLSQIGEMEDWQPQPGPEPPTPPEPPIDPDEFVISVNQSLSDIDGYCYGEYNHSFNLNVGSVYRVDIDVSGESQTIYRPVEKIEKDGVEYIGLRYILDSESDMVLFEVLDLAKYNTQSDPISVVSGNNTCWKAFKLLDEETGDIIPYTATFTKIDFPDIENYFVYTTSGDVDTGLITFTDGDSVYGIVNKQIHFDLYPTLYSVTVSGFSDNAIPFINTITNERADSETIDGHQINYFNGTGNVDYLKLYPNCIWSGVDSLEYSEGYTAFRIRHGADSQSNLVPITFKIEEQ